jgi:hypothetical protein
MNLKIESYKDVKVDSSGSGQDFWHIVWNTVMILKCSIQGSKVSELCGRLLSFQWELWGHPLLNYLLLLCIRKAISLRRDPAKDWTLATDDKILIRTIKWSMQYTEWWVQQTINRFNWNFRIYEGIKASPAGLCRTMHTQLAAERPRTRSGCRRRNAMLYRVSEKSWYIWVSYYVGMYCTCAPCAVYIQMLKASPHTTFELHSISLHTGSHTVSHGR